MISGAPSQKERKLSKNEKKKPPPPPEKWKTGLCDCFLNCGTCCLVSFCFNTIAAQLYTRFVQRSGRRSVFCKKDRKKGCAF